jgi:cytochrome c biogenesis protein CcmG, thiol:disulfide interchange protein DsbE
MIRIWRFLIPLALFAGVVLLFYVSLDRDKETLPSPLIGKPAPEFDLQRLEDPALKVTNREFAGRPYVVNVWATWCVGCRQEHETLLEIAKRGEVPIIGVNWKDDRELAMRWLRQLGDPYVMAGFDGEGRTAIDWGVYGAPETFLVDANGNVVYKHIAPMTMRVWEEEFLPLVRGSAGVRE